MVQNNWVTQRGLLYRNQILQKISEMKGDALISSWSEELDMMPITIRGHLRHIEENKMANVRLFKKFGRWHVGPGIPGKEEKETQGIENR